MTDDAEDSSTAGAPSDSNASQERPAERAEATEPEPTEETETEDVTEATESAVRTAEAEPASGSSADEPATDESTTEEESTADEPTTDQPAAEGPTTEEPAANEPAVPEDVRKYERFQKMDGAQYERVNEFLRDRTHITAREWAIARLCSDFRTETGVEMTKIGENLPELVPFMTDTYTPQAVNQARSSFEEKVRTAGATFLYGAMCNFFTAEELDDVMYEATEVAKFLLEVEGVDLTVDEELEAEDRISSVMQDVRESSEQLRHDELECPHCGEEIHAADD